MGFKIDVKGVEALTRQAKALGEFPHRVVTPAARQAGKLVLGDAKQRAPGGPSTTGDLKRGIILKGERKTKDGKKVYDIMMDPRMNDVFVDMSKSGNRGYYPASMEYGFIAKDGHRVEGHYFLSRALSSNSQRVIDTVLDKALQGLDKALKKG